MLPESRKDQGLVMMRPVSENTTMAHIDAVATAWACSRGAGASASSGARCRRVDVRARQPDDAGVARCRAATSRRSLLAKWLVETPRVLLADEPTRGIDVGAKLAIYELHRTSSPPRAWACC